MIVVGHVCLVPQWATFPLLINLAEPMYWWGRGGHSQTHMAHTWADPVQFPEHWALSLAQYV